MMHFCHIDARFLPYRQISGEGGRCFTNAASRRLDTGWAHASQERL